MNKIINSDCIEGMKQLPGNSVDCCVTSPPYFGLRDYGHEGQIGLEETPEMFVDKMVEVFEQVKRVLKPEGTLWLNLGDSYAANRGYQVGNTVHGNLGKEDERFKGVGSKVPTGMKPKDLIGIPWMVAFALRSAGWYLRQDIIWAKPNPMPESVTDRCTKAHEYIFLLSKSSKYYYDAEAIKTESERAGEKSYHNWNNPKYKAIVHERWKDQFDGRQWGGEGVANKRSVWTVTTKPFSEAHFATFPEDLIVDCIKAGCPENGTVLDPFMGAGTTALVARKLNRNYIGFELNAEYIKIAEKRLRSELGMFL
jgi:DNA modification methylase